VSRLIAESSGEEQALYVLLAATGMRISEVLAVETGHFINDGRTIKVEQQVGKNHPRIVKYLKTSAAKREIDLHTEGADYLGEYKQGSPGCYSQPRPEHRISTASSMIVGSRHASSRAWAGTHSSASAKHGYGVLAVWKS